MPDNHLTTNNQVTTVNVKALATLTNNFFLASHHTKFQVDDLKFVMARTRFTFSFFYDLARQSNAVKKFHKLNYRGSQVDDGTRQS